jgi:glc operon protein GlcG
LNNDRLGRLCEMFIARGTLSAERVRCRRSVPAFWAPGFAGQIVAGRRLPSLWPSPLTPVATLPSNAVMKPATRLRGASPRRRRAAPPSKPILLLFAIGLAVSAAAPRAPAEAPPYGAPIDLAAARAVLAAAQAEAEAHRWRVAIAIVDSGGHLVLFERVDSTQYGSAEVAIAKARTAAAFRRPSKAFQDELAAGGAGLRLLGLTGAMPIDGGVPLVHGGRIVGAIGVSGVTSAQDGQIARAGAAALARAGGSAPASDSGR